MGDTKSLQTELSRLDDLVDAIELKIHNLAGLLELLYLGIRTLNRVEDSYELCAVNLILNYLEMIETVDILKLHAKVSELKERV